MKDYIKHRPDDNSKTYRGDVVGIKHNHLLYTQLRGNTLIPISTTCLEIANTKHTCIDLIFLCQMSAMVTFIFLALLLYMDTGWYSPVIHL